jgi:hypothetical protein
MINPELPASPPNKLPTKEVAEAPTKSHSQVSIMVLDKLSREMHEELEKETNNISHSRNVVGGSTQIAEQYRR